MQKSRFGRTSIKQIDKNLLKIEPRSLEIALRSSLGAILVEQERPRASKSVPRASQECPKSGQERPRARQESEVGAQDASKKGSWEALGRILVVFHVLRTYRRAASASTNVGAHDEFPAAIQAKLARNSSEMRRSTTFLARHAYVMPQDAPRAAQGPRLDII